MLPCLFLFSFFVKVSLQNKSCTVLGIQRGEEKDGACFMANVLKSLNKPATIRMGDLNKKIIFRRLWRCENDKSDTQKLKLKQQQQKTPTDNTLKSIGYPLSNMLQ